MANAALASRKPKPTDKIEPPSNESDFVWGGQAIADALGCSLETFYYLNNRGAFGDAVFRLGHKTLVASRAKLCELPALAHKTL